MVSNYNDYPDFETKSELSNEPNQWNDETDPKGLTVIKKTCQVHNTGFKLKVIKWHIDQNSMQQDTSNHFKITQ